MAVVVGIGNRARQGKDYVAKYIFKAFPGKIEILHWADALYVEAVNITREKPLIKKVTKLGQDFYYLLTSDIPECYFAQEVPEVKEFMDKRKIDVYWGMDGKDSEILQLWGTAIRRKKFSESYWVDKTIPSVKTICETKPNSIILIPDTRFYSEYNAIKELNGFYVSVVRLNENGERYFASDRDNNHQSEKELDNAKHDYLIVARSGDLECLERASVNFIYYYNLTSTSLGRK